MSQIAPLVTVITATYNWSSVLRCAIQSVLWQTFTDFEYLVIGDGCTDDSGEVVASFNDPRVRWHNLPENTGNQSVPNNTAIGMARGDYIAYLGHDDLWHPTHLANLVQCAKSTGADLVHAWLVMIGPPGTGIRSMRGIHETAPTVEHPGFTPPSAFMHRRQMIDDTGGWRDPNTLYDGPDYDLWMRAIRAGKQFAAVEELTAFKFPSPWRKNSYVEKPWREQAEYLQRMKDEPDFLYQELKAIAAAYALDRTTARSLNLPKADRSRPGALTQWRRQVRGLPVQSLPDLTLADRLEIVRRGLNRRIPRRFHFIRSLRRRLKSW